MHDWNALLQVARHQPPAQLLGCTSASTADEIRHAWETLDASLRHAASELPDGDARHRAFGELAQAALDARDLLLATCG